jgi:hypothetical protein
VLETNGRVWGQRERGFALGCAMGERESCLKLMEEFGGKERGIFALGCAMGGRER